MGEQRAVVDRSAHTPAQTGDFPGAISRTDNDTGSSKNVNKRGDERITRLRHFVVLTVLMGLLGTATAVAVADPNLPDITPHRHFIQTPTGGLVQVGPRVCDRPSLQHAFNQFHSNIHIAVSGSPGPEHSAPGLHNFKGGEITPRPCSFTP